MLTSLVSVYSTEVQVKTAKESREVPPSRLLTVLLFPPFGKFHPSIIHLSSVHYPSIKPVCRLCPTCFSSVTEAKVSTLRNFHPLHQKENIRGCEKISRFQAGARLDPAWERWSHLASVEPPQQHHLALQLQSAFSVSTVTQHRSGARTVNRKVSLIFFFLNRIQFI